MTSGKTLHLSESHVLKRPFQLRDHVELEIGSEVAPKEKGRCVSMCVCVCVCVCERERERENVCVHVLGVHVCECVCAHICVHVSMQGHFSMHKCVHTCLYVCF